MKKPTGFKLILIIVVMAGKILSRMYLRIAESVERKRISGKMKPPKSSSSVSVLLALLYFEKHY
jgi:hypothetical protein